MSKEDEYRSVIDDIDQNLVEVKDLIGKGKQLTIGEIEHVTKVEKIRAYLVSMKNTELAITNERERIRIMSSIPVDTKWLEKLTKRKEFLLTEVLATLIREEIDELKREVL